MPPMINRFALSVFLVLICVGCSSTTEPTDTGSDTGTTLSNGSMSATIDGVTWTAAAITATNSGGQVAIGATSSSLLSINLFLLVNGPGTYTVNSAISSFLVSQANSGASSTWTAANGLAGSSATVTLTTLTTARAVGTFSGVVVARAGTAAVGTRTITNGRFDVRF
jgi:hypothetical protein